jgi:signal transduction histidine kinase
MNSPERSTGPTHLGTIDPRPTSDRPSERPGHLAALAAEISEAAGEADSPDQVAAAFLRCVAVLLPYDGGGMLLAGGPGHPLLPVGPVVPCAFAPDGTMIDWAFAERRPVQLPAPGSAASSLVMLPVMNHGRRAGLAFFRVPGPPQDERVLANAAVLARIAVLSAGGIRLHAELQRRERQIVLAEAQLDRAAQLAAVGEIAAGVLHEIKNPLQILMMHLDMFDRGHALPDWRELFRQQVKRLSDIVRRLMHFSRMASGAAAWGTIDLNRAIRETLAIVAHEFRSDDVVIREELDESLRPLPGDEGAVQQVILGLLVNARDAMPKGGTVLVRTMRDESEVRVEVRDTGRGIAVEDVGRIFEPLYSSGAEGRGTGLGLYLARRVMERHGGSILVESTPGAGSTFILLFPLSNPAG